jgi:hypothetical protein
VKKLVFLFIAFLFVLNIYSQSVNYYDEGVNAMENVRTLGANSGSLHTFGGRRYKGTKGTPNLFDSLVSSNILLNGQEKYIQVESDINVLINAVIFRDASSGELREIPSEKVKELIFNKYDKKLIYRTTKEIKFDKKIKENKFYQVVRESPYRLIMITYKTFSKADNEPTFNSGRQYDEFRAERKFYLEDSKGVFHQVVFNKVDYDCLVQPSLLTKKELAKMFPDKKKLIYTEFEVKPDSVSIERIISLLDKF